MVTDPETTSLFTLDEGASANSENLADVRVIHESTNGYCVVYTGVYHGRRIAFKALKPRYRSSELHQQMLRKEFDVASMMNHPNIIATLRMENLPDHGEAILMEYIEGMTLNEFLASNPRIGSKQLQTITEQICRAVSYIHSRQTVHCDLKPANILITSAGAFVKIIDFGMSRGNGFETLDLAGGTRGFTAPENFRPDARASAATDIYSIGKIMELMDRDATIKSVWRRCIADRPESRPASANEILELLSLDRSRKKRLKRFAFIAIALTVIGLLLIPEFINRPTVTSQPPTADSEVPLRPETPTKPEETLKDAQPENQTDITGETQPALPAEETEAIKGDETTEAGTFEAELTKKFEQVASRRFSEHLMLIDTMTTLRSVELQQVSHWRWLAKQDMKRWLTENLGTNYQKIEEEMSQMNQRLDEFMKADDRQHTEWVHRTEAAKHEPYRNGCSTKYAYFEGLDIVVARRLGEDGVWRETRTQIPVNRLDPEETMKTRAEYMKKAMED